MNTVTDTDAAAPADARVRHLTELLDEAERLHQLSEHETGLAVANQAADQTTETDGVLRVRALCLQVKHLMANPLPEHCLELSNEALTLARRINDVDAELAATIVLAKSHHRTGLLRDAFELGLQAVDVARKLGDRASEAVALGTLSMHYLDSQDIHQARQLLDASYEAAKEAGDVRQMFWALNDASHTIGLLADECIETGDRAAALELADEMERVLDEAHVIARKQGSVCHETWASANMATVYFIREDLAAAETQIRSYRALALQYDLPRLVVYADLDEARLFVAQHNYGAALQLLESSEHQAQLAKFPGIAIPSHDACYRAAKTIQDFERALYHLERRNAIERERTHLLAERQARFLLAQLDVARAEAAVERANLEAEMQQLRSNALQHERDQLHRAAREDSLTGLGNRRAADELLGQVLSHTSVDKPAAVAFVDLDYFKNVNDRYGHATGDKVLIDVAQILQKSLRPGDFVFRFGGEEFLLVFTDTSAQRSSEACERIRMLVETFDWGYLGELKVTASFGVVCTQMNETPSTLMARADLALYSAKKSGRNCVVAGSFQHTLLE
jgi:diguanylate cyclase (GGDEF)-like protein